jgi:leucyl-tRNA synthetase
MGYAQGSWRPVDPLVRETNTMPQWAGSCWYYLRYLDPHNDARFVDPALEKYWMPVDLYVGGVEHAVLHLLYARFWHKVLFDLGYVSTPEPFARLVNQGLILGEMEFHEFRAADGTPVSVEDCRDIAETSGASGPQMTATDRKTGQTLIGLRIADDLVDKTSDGFRLRSNPAIRVDGRSFKMSKSRGNVVNPDEIVRDFGADTFRLYEMYLGPLEVPKPWNTRDIVGMSRFLSSVWRNLIGETPEHSESAGAAPAAAPSTDTAPISSRIVDEPIEPDLDRALHFTIQKVAADIKSMRFNTAIAALITLNNQITGLKKIPRELAENFVLMLSPFTPHIAEEIWQQLGHASSLSGHRWPEVDPAKLVVDRIELPVQVNGKLRGKITMPIDADEATVLAAAEAVDSVKPWLADKTLVRKMYVPKRLVNFVVK